MHKFFFLVLTLAVPVGQLIAEPFLEIDHGKTASSLKYLGWREPYNQKGILKLVPDDTGAKFLEIAVNGSANPAIEFLPKSEKAIAVSSGQVYVIEFEARSVGQIEGVNLIMRRKTNPYTPHGSDSFPVVREWARYSTQIRVKNSDDQTAFIFDLKGVGQFQIRSVTISTTPAFAKSANAEKTRGALLANSGFQLGPVGWTYTAAGWDDHLVKFHAPSRPSEFVTDPEGHLAFQVPAGIFGFLTYNVPLELRLGKTYRVEVKGSGARNDVTAWFARPGQNITIIQKLPLEFKEGKATALYTHQMPEFGTFSSRPQSAYFRLEHFGKEPLQVNGMQVFELDSPDQPGAVHPDIAVQVMGLDSFQDSSAVAGEHPLSAKVTSFGFPKTTEGNLQVINASGDQVMEQKFVLEPSPENTSSVEIPLKSLPLGWYQINVTTPGEASLALSDRFVILPRKSSVASKPFLGAHLEAHNLREVEYLSRLGIRSARCFEFSWPYLEKEKGKFHFPMEVLDRYLEAGIEPLIMLNGSPKWASTATEEAKADKGFPPAWSSYPPDTESWEVFVRKMVQLLKPKGIKIYQIWNEPNGYFLKIDPKIDSSLASAYVRLVKSAYKIIKEEDPSAKVVAGATAGQAFDFFKECFDLGMLDHCDIISYHAYGETQMANQGAAPFAGSIKTYRELMAKFNVEKPIWDCESGYNIPAGAAGFRDSMMLAQGVIAREAAGLQRYYIYDAYPRAFPGHSNFHMVTGFANDPLVSQPLLAAYDRLLGAAKFSRIVKDTEGVHLFEYLSHDGKPILVGWHSQPGEKVEAASPVASGQSADAFGNQTGEFKDGKIELTKEVRYFAAPEIFAALRR